MMEPRGIRNCNPLNIRTGSRSRKPWKGEIRPSLDPEFCQFSDMAHGYRAAMLLLRDYRTLYGLRTPRELISRWAPPSENDTRGYLGAVCKLTGLDPDEPIDLSRREVMTSLVAAMSQVENRRRAVTEDVEAGWHLL